jgi:hypothetical protein
MLLNLGKNNTIFAPLISQPSFGKATAISPKPAHIKMRKPTTQIRGNKKPALKPAFQANKEQLIALSPLDR